MDSRYGSGASSRDLFSGSLGSALAEKVDVLAFQGMSLNNNGSEVVLDVGRIYQF